MAKVAHLNFVRGDPMLPLFDMMMQGENGAFMQTLTKQFNLAQEQGAKAVAALMPAFSAALKRNSENPNQFADLMKTAASGDYVRYFEDLSRAFTPQGLDAGNSALGRIFGSPELANAVSAQAAQFTGVGQDIMKRMMPVVADAVMGGLVKQMTGQLDQVPNMFAGTPMEGAMQQWLESVGLRRKPQPMPTMFDNPFTDAMKAFFTPPAPEKPANDDPFSLNAYTKAMQDMMAAGFAATRMEQPASEKPKPAAAPASDFSTMMNAMLDSGLDVQKNYQKSMEGLFDLYWKRPE